MAIAAAALRVGSMLAKTSGAIAKGGKAAMVKGGKMFKNSKKIQQNIKKAVFKKRKINKDTLLSKDRTQKKKLERDKRKQEEELIEKGNNEKKKSNPSKIMKKGGGILQTIINFISTVLVGWVVVNLPKIISSVKKVIKKIKKEPVKYSVDKALSQKVQLQSIKNQAKYPSQFGKQINKGNTPVKVDLSKPINFDKYIGTTKPKKSIKKFGSERPTGTFTDDLPPVQNKPLTKKKFSNEHYDWREDLGEDWQKVNRKDKTDGLSKAAVKAYRRENPGSKLQTAVTKDPKKLKKGSKSAKRRLSFCRRMKGMKKRLTSAKTARDPNSRINKALRRWNC